MMDTAAPGTRGRGPLARDILLGAVSPHWERGWGRDFRLQAELAGPRGAELSREEALAHESGVWPAAPGALQGG